jgi:hypothetical protein
MALKTFNIDPTVHKRFSEACKKYGISMSKQVENFMASQVETEPKVRAEYLRKLEAVRKGKFLMVDNFSKRYGL